WRLPSHPPVGPLVVVVSAEADELGLQLPNSARPAPCGQVLLQALVEALDLATGLGVIGLRVLVGDAQADELQLDGAGAVAGLGREDGAVVGQAHGPEDPPYPRPQ